MENASKALIIAGEVLIGVMVITLLISVVTLFGRFSANMHEDISRAQISEFNSNFYSYDHRTNITATEIVTVINFAKHANDSRELKYDDTSEFYVRVIISDERNRPHDLFKEIGSDKYNNKKSFSNVLDGFLKECYTSYFSCNVTVTKDTITGTLKVTDTTAEDIKVNEDTYLVNEIHFHKIDEDVSSIPNPGFESSPSPSGA